MHVGCAMALFYSEAPVVLQKVHSTVENLNSETPGDRNFAFLHWEDVSDVCK